MAGSFSDLLSLSPNYSFAQVATAPYFMDQRIINPAVSPSRTVFGHAAQLKRQTEEDQVLGLTDSSIQVKTTVDTLEFNSSLRSGLYTWEINLSPQLGTKKTDTVSVSASSLGSQTYISKITLIPIQVALGYKSSGNFKYGLKLLFTPFELKDLVDYAFGGQDSTVTVHDDRKYSGNFLVVAPGMTYTIRGTGFSFGYVADFYQFDQNFKNDSTSTRTNSTSTTLRTDSSQFRDRFVVRKDILGLGYFKSFSAGKNFRIDLSMEKMPPLSRSDFFENGELSRLVAEVNFSFFRIGVETTQRKGFYVDPYNLVPFFYKLEKQGNESVQETSFFGGLKTAKGHSFGIFYSQANSTVQEASANLGVTQTIDRKNSSMSLSYSYVY